jgi:hypothetical protein
MVTYQFKNGEVLRIDRVQRDVYDVAVQGCDGLTRHSAERLTNWGLHEELRALGVGPIVMKRLVNQVRGTNVPTYPVG